MVIRTFIVEDEYQNRNLLSKMLSDSGQNTQIMGFATNVNEALQGIATLNPDLVFMDVKLENETSFEILHRLPEIHFELIFITAYDEYALKAFRFNAVDYLLKPLIQSELQDALKKVQQKLIAQHFMTHEQMKNLYNAYRNNEICDKLTIPTSDGFTVFPLEDVIYCRAEGSYTLFILRDNKTHLASYTLKQYVELLTAQSFFRTHRSYLINLRHVKMYKRGEGGSIIMSNGEEIELSRQHKESFMQIFKPRT